MSAMESPSADVADPTRLFGEIAVRLFMLSRRDRPMWMTIATRLKATAMKKAGSDR